MATTDCPLEYYFFSLNNYNLISRVVLTELVLPRSSLAQLRWIYVSPSAKHYNVGLYHGDRSKHVLVHINNSISVIDFSVKEDKTYTFYIEEQLCELSLQDEGDHWSYAFEINTVALTPANIQRRKREQRYLLYSILFLIGFVGLIILLKNWIM